MALRVTNIRLGVDEPESALSGRLAKLLGLPPEALGSWRILRKSLDARDKDALQFVYHAEVRLPEGEARVLERIRGRVHAPAQVEPFHETPFKIPPAGSRALDHRPVIVGSGPAGLIAAYFLAEQGYKPLVLERGRAVRDRIRDC